MSSTRVIALYLPQFYPIKENDEIWGKGFTEWTNVAKAKPLFRGHYQPQIPSELGFYDLRLDDIRIEQAELASQYGIEGFCYWHYWFGKGKQVLEMPIFRIMNTRQPDFPFCLAWANHSWATSTWNNTNRISNDQVFLKQEYLGIEDYTDHFYKVLPMFRDKRYITVDGKPFFAIFAPFDIPVNELKLFIQTWRELAYQNGLKGIHFVGRLESISKVSDDNIRLKLAGNYYDYYQKYLDLGFDAIWSNNMKRAQMLSKGYLNMVFKRALEKYLGIRVPDKYRYSDIIEYYFTQIEGRENVYPMIIPRWDKTPRQGKLATIYTDNSPELFYQHAKSAVELVKDKDKEHRIILVQAWNEWGEGNYLEPDIRYGRKYLEVLSKAIEETSCDN